MSGDVNLQSRECVGPECDKSRGGPAMQRDPREMHGHTRSAQHAG